MNPKRGETARAVSARVAVSGVEAKAMKVGCRFFRIGSARAMRESLEGALGNG